MEGIPSSIDERMNYNLTKDITENEIRQAVFDMNPDKAPDPNGMTPLFLQKYWSIVGTDIVSAIQSFFYSNFLFKSVNVTIITLIPKLESPP